MSDSLKNEIVRGAGVNAIGIIGKAAGPLFLIAVVRLFGVDIFGVYISALAIVETALALLIAGFKDGALVFVARHADADRSHPKLYIALANALGWSLGFSILLIALAATVGLRYLPIWYPEFGEELSVMVLWMSFSLPLLAFERVVISATQGLKIMRYEAIVNGFLRPLLLLILAVIISFFAKTIFGLILAYLITQAAVVFFAAYVYHSELSWKHLYTAVTSREIDRELFLFAVPQNVNAAFSRFATNIDILMLGLFGFSAAMTGLYGAGALVVRELRHIKLVFSTSLAPHIARLYDLEQKQDLAHLFSTTVRWTTSLLIPAMIVVALLRNDILAIASPDFGFESALFMVALLPIPYLQGSLGFAGNVLVMAGYSRLNLYNSVGGSVLNIVLNLILIPLYGLIGAAIASSVAALLKTMAEYVQMRTILNVLDRRSEYFQPQAAGLAIALVIVVSEIYAWNFLQTLPGRMVFTTLCMLGFVAFLTAFMRRLPWKEPL